MTPTRWAALVVLAGAIFFAVEGGEYGTSDVAKLRHDELELARQVADLRRAIDSLRREAVAIETDRRVQERVARESFGMIRRGEFLYKLVPRDDATANR